jgi:hypothetical protein
MDIVNDGDEVKMPEEFDATQFMLDTRNEEALETEGETLNDEHEETQEEIEDNNAEPENEIEGETVQETETETEASFSWSDSDEDEPVEDTEETTVAETTESWQSLSEELGINVESIEEFKDVLKQYKDLAQHSVSNEAVKNLNTFLELDDEQLMREELKAQQYSKDEIEDEIDLMIENGSLKSAARKVRKDVETAIEREREVLSKNLENPHDAKQREQEEALSAELKEYMSKTNTFFGGKISSTQKQEHLEYIDSGDFFGC